MANEDFGLSFTTSQPAIWTDFLEGHISESTTIFADVTRFEKISEPTTLFADIVALEKISEPTTIFADIVALDKISEPVSFDATGICAAPSRMSGPGSSILGAGGQQNIASACP